MWGDIINLNFVACMEICHTVPHGPHHFSVIDVRFER
jgi:hypothetical protein